MIHEPLVSVIVPMHNSAKTVERTLRSVLEQSETDLEVIAVDDGSTDSGPVLVERVAVQDRRVRLVRQPRQGVAAARNTGLDVATGRWVHFLDADDTIEAEAYEVLIGAAERRGTAAAAGAFRLVGPGGEELVTQHPRTDEIGLDDLIDKAVILTMSHLVRREAMGKLRFDPRYRVYEDLDLWLRLGESGVRWACVRDVVATYHIRPGSLSKNAGVMIECSQRMMRACFERVRGVRTRADLRELDTSESRLSAKQYHFALDFATRAALVGGDVGGANVAAKLFAAAQGPKRITPQDAGAKGYWQSLYGLGRVPSGEPKDPAIRALREFWAQCARRGWASADLPQKAMDVLAMRLARPVAA